MTVESDIFDCLKGLVGNRVYPDVAPAGTPPPFMTYQQVGGDAVAFLESVMPSKRNGRFQISVWADTRAAASELMRQAENLLITSATLRAEAMGAAVSLYEEDTKRYGSRQFFSIWY